MKIIPLLIPAALSVSCGSAPTPYSFTVAPPPPALLEAAADGANELVFPRHPSLSPDSSQVAFSHQGDIWVAAVSDGRARRLTAHDAYDGTPLWSPDGSKLAFLSTRFGNNDVFVVAVEGGAPQRVTWHSEHDQVHGWLDHDRLLLSRTGTRMYSRRGRGAWVGYLDGRTPTMLVDTAMLRPAATAGGGVIAYERGHGDPRRRGYRGSASSALWLWDAASGEHHALTDFDGNDLNPMWSPTANHVYFTSDRECVGNEDGRELGLWRVDVANGAVEVVFNAGDASLRNPNISADGSKVVAELGAGLVLIDTIDGSTSRLPVFGSFDPSVAEQYNKTVSSDAKDLAVSPDGESVAFVSGGDIYVLRKHDKIQRCARVSTNPAPDYSPVWIEDGEALLFVSERDGNGEFYRAKPVRDDLPFYRAVDFEITRLTETSVDESAPALSPDGKRMAWARGPGELVVGSPLTFEIERVLYSGFEAPSFEWAPDSRWLAWSAVNDDFNYDIFIGRADQDFTPFNLTTHPDDDTNPHWSPDGRKLAFTSRRQMLDETDVWVAWLNRDDAEMSERERLEAAEAKQLAKEEEEKKKKELKKKDENKDEPAEEGEEEEDDGEEEPVLVEIDFSDLSLRLRRLTKFEANEKALGWSHDSEKVYFNVSQGTRLTSGTSGEKGFFEVDIWDRETDELESETISSLVLVDKTVFYVKKGKIVGREEKAETYPFSVRVREDRPALRAAIIDEGWRALDRMFYDPAFHGHDWAASLAKWRPLAASASTAEDFSVSMNWMLGEMNASHMGFYGGGKSEAKETDKQITGALGVIWDDQHQGAGRKVAEVIKGMPAARANSALAVGDIVLSVNSISYVVGENWARLMLATAGEECFLKVVNAAGEEREVAIRPSAWSAVRKALYTRKVEMARAKVETESAGNLGYIHIEGMGQSSLLEFERDLFRAASGKSALLIDVRENGGGWTTDMVLAMLMVKNHAITIPRGGGVGYPQGRRIFATWDKPIVVLCNENSYSNAEIFSWSIKTLGRGPVVGKKTYGAVISTGAAHLLDGSYVRLPFRGWYVNNAERTNMELNGCPPDYPVENLPGDFSAGIDRQLDKAIAVGLDLIAG